MKWEEVRNLYPNQYVKLNILDFYLEDDKKIVTDVALINVIEDSKLATKELLKSKRGIPLFIIEVPRKLLLK